MKTNDSESAMGWRFANKDNNLANSQLAALSEWLVFTFRCWEVQNISYLNEFTPDPVDPAAQPTGKWEHYTEKIFFHF